MRKLILTLTLSFIFLSAFSQTKLIAHRSHSGKNFTFGILGNSNFGLVMREFDQAHKRRIDSIKLDRLQKQDSLKKLNQHRLDSIHHQQNLPVTQQRNAADKLASIALGRP